MRMLLRLHQKVLRQTISIQRKVFIGSVVVRIVPHVTSNQVSSGLCEMHAFAAGRFHLWCSIRKTEARASYQQQLGTRFPAD